MGAAARNTAFWWWLALLLAGCSIEQVPFECDSDDQCSRGGENGMCQKTGYCSFDDSACDSGQRYAELAAADLSEQCVVACIEELSLGAAHSCALLTDGSLRCWGAQGQGRLGNGSVEPGVQPTAVIVGGVPPFKGVSLGAAHSCALTAEGGSVWCWGDNTVLQLSEPGAGPGPLRIAALDVAGTAVTQVAAGGFHNCARASGGQACWGHNERGQLGSGSAGNPSSIAAVSFNPALQEIAAGEAHSCGRTIAGTVHCWGDNRNLQVGGADPMGDHSTPILVPTPLRAAQLALGLLHSCMLTSDETVACWGNNQLAGQLGRNQAFVESPTPIAIGLPEAIVQLDAGSTHSCALGQSGTAYCWGGNEQGQHGPGRGQSPFEPDPVAVELPGGIVQIATGGLHTCALTGRDEVYCWGGNEFGQLGNGEIEADGQSEPDKRVTAQLICD
jgi:alpha-tubulin suppressor-like RCC1 family protein